MFKRGEQGQPTQLAKVFRYYLLYNFFDERKRFFFSFTEEMDEHLPLKGKAPLLLATHAVSTLVLYSSAQCLF